METRTRRAPGLLAGLLLLAASTAWAQGAPQVLWEVPTPSGLANNIAAVDWAPGAVGRVALGSSDRWVRVRNAADGGLVYSSLQPHRAGTADQIIYSDDAQYLAVHNSSEGLDFRIYRASDGVFLGMVKGTVQPSNLLSFVADAQLQAAVGGDGSLSKWRRAIFTLVRVVGSGYDRVTTTYTISPNGAYQAAASQGSITVQSRSNGSTVGIFTGGNMKGSTPMVFTPDSTRLAAWSRQPNRTTLWRISDGAVVGLFPGAASNEGVGALRFSPDGTRLVTCGYLPFLTPDGLWDQKGTIRFWRVADGALRTTFDARTGLGVTSPIAWSPDASRFVYGTYEGTAVAALTPPP